nr:hypothetical protein [Tanacetum cinerariifolium]
MIQVRLNATVKNIHIDNGTEFVNQTLRSYYEDVGISHETSVGCTSKQNNVFERQNQTLVEAACTIALCYPTNNNEDMGKLKAKADIGIFIGYAPANVDYLVFVVATLEPADSTDTPSSTSIDQYAPSPKRPTTNKAEFVKAAERPTTDKVETAKKPAVRYAEMYRRTLKRPAGQRPHGPPMRPQYRALWVPTVNRNFPLLIENFPLVTQMFPLFVATAQDMLTLLDQRQ